MSTDRTILLKEKLENLKMELSQIGDRNPDLTQKLGRSQGEIQLYFQSQILDLPIFAASSEIEAKIFAYYVELNKQIKLLGVDFNMLQVARNPTTWRQRQQQAIARLSTLISYCEAII
jgi:hypothetical protein